MKKLQMIFKNGTGKKVTLTQRDCRDDLTAETVREVMSGVANLALIEKKRGRPIRRTRQRTLR